MRQRNGHSLYSFWKSGLASLLAPAILGAILILVLIEVANFGGIRESLAANAEAAVLRWALVFSRGEADPASSGIVSISVNDSDLLTVRRAASGIKDASIDEYASVLEKVALTNPKWVVLNWLTFAHPLSPEYLKPLTSVIDRLGISDRVTIAVNLNATETISADFARAYNIVEARDCYYSVNVYCSVVPEWTWMPQQVISRFMRAENPWVVSRNLPHILPNIVLNMKSSEPLVQYSFLDFRPPVMANIPEGAAVFIGNNATQEFIFRDNKEVIQKTFVADSRRGGSLMSHGVPLHEFWARMARMFESGHLLAVMPMWVEWIVIGALIVFFMAGVWLVQERTLWALVGFAVLFPIFEVSLVRYASVYVPIVPLATALMILFLSGTFFSLAYSNFSKWRLQALSAVAVSTADIKENFIHLISHNLNTPISQLRGILDLLKSNDPGNKNLTDAGSGLEFIRVIVRAVLNTTTMASQGLISSPVPFRALIERFRETESSFFDRLGIALEFMPSADDEEHGEIWFYKFDLDLEFTIKSIFYAMTTLVLSGGVRGLSLRFAPFTDEPAMPGGLEVSITKVGGGLSLPADNPEFPEFALIRFLDMASRRGVLEYERGEGAIKVRFGAV